MRIRAASLLLTIAVVASAAACSSDAEEVPTGVGGTGTLAGYGGTSGRGNAGRGGRQDAAPPWISGNACPANFILAEGDPCSPEGKVCDEGGVNPREFDNALKCTGGVWVRSDAFPEP